MKNLKKLFKTGAITLMAAAMVASMSAVAFADADPSGTLVGKDEVSIQDWQSTYGADGYLVMAGSGGGDKTSVYSNLYQNNDGTSVIYGTGAYGYKTLVSTDKTAATALTLKENAVISNWGVSAGTETYNTSAKNTLYIPGTTTPTYARVHNSGNKPWYVHTNFKTTVDDLYVTIYFAGNWDSTAISSTNYLDVGLYSGYINRQVCGTAEDQTAATAWAYYTDAGLTELATTSVTRAATYVTFKTGVAGDYTIILGSETDGVSAGTIKPMLGGVFFDTTEPAPVSDTPLVASASCETIGNDWEGVVGNAGYMIASYASAKTTTYYSFEGIQAIATAAGATAPTESDSIKLFNDGVAFTKVGTGTITSEGDTTWTPGEGDNNYNVYSKTSNGNGVQAAYSNLFEDADDNNYVVLNADTAFLHQYGTGLLMSKGGYKADAIVTNIYTNCNTWSSSSDYLTAFKPGTTTQAGARVVGNNNNNNGNAVYQGYSFTTSQDNVYVTMYIAPTWDKIGGPLKDSTITVGVWKDVQCNLTNNGASAYTDAYLGFPVDKATLSIKGGYFTFLVKNAGTYFIGSSVKVDDAFVNHNSQALFFDTVLPTYEGDTKYVSSIGYDSLGGDWTGRIGNAGYVLGTLSNSTKAAYSDLFTDADSDGIVLLNGTGAFASQYGTGLLMSAGGYKADAVVNNIYTNANTWSSGTYVTPYKPGTRTQTNGRVQGNATSGSVTINSVATQVNCYLGYSFTTTQANVYVTLYVMPAENNANNLLDNTITVGVWKNVQCNQTNNGCGAYYVGCASLTNLPSAQQTLTLKGGYITFLVADAGTYFIGASVKNNTDTYASALVPGLFFDTTAPDYDASRTSASTVNTYDDMGGEWEGLYGKQGYLIATLSDDATPTYAYYNKGIFTGTDGAKVSVAFNNTGSGFLGEMTPANGYQGTSLITNLVTNAGTFNTSTNKASPYAPGTTTEPNVRVQGNGGGTNNDGMLGYSFTTTADDVYVTVYVLKNGSSAGTFTVSSYLNFVPTVAQAYTNATYTSNPLPTAESTTVVEGKKGAYVTFKLPKAGNYFIGAGVDSGAVIMPAIFVDTTAPATYVAPTASYVSYNKTLDGDWEGTYGSAGYFIPGFETAATAYSKNVFSGVDNDAKIELAYTTANQTRTVTNAFSGDTISSLSFLATTFQKGGTGNYTHNLYVPGTEDSERVIGRVCAGSGSHVAAFSFRVTADAFENYADDDGYIYVSMYNAFANGYSQESVVFKAALYSGSANITNTNASVWDNQNGEWKNSPLATTKIVVKSQTGYFVTFKIKGVGTYTIATVNNLWVNQVGSNGLFFDSAAPVGASAEEDIPTETIASDGNGTATYVQTDSYSTSNWDAGYGADGYFMFGEPTVSGSDIYAATGSTIYTKGIFTEGASATVGNMNGLTTSGGMISWNTDYTIATNPIYDRVYATGSLNRAYTTTQGLYIPGTTDMIKVETGSAGAGEEIPFGITINKVDSADMYITMYMYNNSYSASAGADSSAIQYYTAGVIKGKYTSAYTSTDATAVTGSLRYQVKYLANNANILAEQENIDVSTGGKYVTFKVTGTGLYTFYVFAQDSVKSGACLAGLFFDKTLYQATINAAENITVSGRTYAKPNGNFAFTATASAIDEAPQKAVVKLGDDTLTATAGVYSVANVSENKTFTITSAPDYTISATLTAGTITENSIAVTATATGTYGTNKYYFSTDGSTWSAEQAEATYTFSELTALTTYTLYVKVVDGNGIETTANVANVKTKADYTISATLTAGTVTGTTIPVTVSATGKAGVALTYSFKLGDGEWSTAQDSASYEFTGLTGLTEYTLYVKVVDANGEEATASVTATTLVDYTLSVTLAKGTVTGTSVAVTATASGKAGVALTYYFSKDNTNWTAGQDSATYTFTDLAGLTDYTLYVKVVDANSQEATASVTATTLVDYTLSVTLAKGTVTGTSVAVTATASGKAGVALTYYFSKDNTNWTAGQDSATYTFTDLAGLTNYTLYVKVVDANSQEATANVTATTLVDYTLSVTLAKGTVTGTSVAVTATASGKAGVALTYYFSKDNTNWTAGQDSATYTFTGLTGLTNYTLYVKVVDANSQEATANVTATTLVDYEITTVTIDAIETATDSITVAVVATGAKGSPITYYYKLGDGEWSEGTTDTTYTFSELTADTEYTISVKVVDGNSVEKTGTVAISTSAPAPAKQGCGGAIAMLSAFMGVIALAVVGKKY